MNWKQPRPNKEEDFFQSTRTDQNSSSKFYEILWCQIETLRSRNCREVLQALSKIAGYFFIKHGKFRDHAWKDFFGLICSFLYLS